MVFLLLNAILLELSLLNKLHYNIILSLLNCYKLCMFLVHCLWTKFKNHDELGNLKNNNLGNFITST